MMENHHDQQHHQQQSYPQNRYHSSSLRSRRENYPDPPPPYDRTQGNWRNPSNHQSGSTYSRRNSYENHQSSSSSYTRQRQQPSHPFHQSYRQHAHNSHHEQRSSCSGTTARRQEGTANYDYRASRNHGPSPSICRSPPPSRPNTLPPLSKKDNRDSTHLVKKGISETNNTGTFWLAKKSPHWTRRNTLPPLTNTNKDGQNSGSGNKYGASAVNNGSSRAKQSSPSQTPHWTRSHTLPPLTNTNKDGQNSSRGSKYSVSAVNNGSSFLAKQSSSSQTTSTTQESETMNIRTSQRYRSYFKKPDIDEQNVKTPDTTGAQYKHGYANDTNRLQVERRNAKTSGKIGRIKTENRSQRNGNIINPKQTSTIGQNMQTLQTYQKPKQETDHQHDLEKDNDHQYGLEKDNDHQFKESGTYQPINVDIIHQRNVTLKSDRNFETLNSERNDITSGIDRPIKNQTERNIAITKLKNIFKRPKIDLKLKISNSHLNFDIPKTELSPTKTPNTHQQPVMKDNRNEHFQLEEENSPSDKTTSNVRHADGQSPIDTHIQQLEENVDMYLLNQNIYEQNAQQPGIAQCKQDAIQRIDHSNMQKAPPWTDEKSIHQNMTNNKLNHSTIESNFEKSKGIEHHRTHNPDNFDASYNDQFYTVGNQDFCNELNEHLSEQKNEHPSTSQNEHLDESRNTHLNEFQSEHSKESETNTDQITVDRNNSDNEGLLTLHGETNSEIETLTTGIQYLNSSTQGLNSVIYDDGKVENSVIYDDGKVENSVIYDDSNVENRVGSDTFANENISSDNRVVEGAEAQIATVNSFDRLQDTQTIPILGAGVYETVENGVHSNTAVPHLALNQAFDGGGTGEITAVNSLEKMQKNQAVLYHDHTAQIQSRNNMRIPMLLRNRQLFKLPSEMYGSPAVPRTAFVFHYYDTYKPPEINALTGYPVWSTKTNSEWEEGDNTGKKNSSSSTHESQNMLSETNNPTHESQNMVYAVNNLTQDPQHNVVYAVSNPTQDPHHMVYAVNNPHQEPQHNIVYAVDNPPQEPQHNMVYAVNNPPQEPQHNMVYAVNNPTQEPQHNMVYAINNPTQEPQHLVYAVNIPSQEPQNMVYAVNNPTQEPQNLVYAGNNSTQEPQHLIYTGNNPPPEPQHLVYTGNNPTQEPQHTIVYAVNNPTPVPQRNMVYAFNNPTQEPQHNMLPAINNSAQDQPQQVLYAVNNPRQDAQQMVYAVNVPMQEQPQQIMALVNHDSTNYPNNNTIAQDTNGQCFYIQPSYNTNHQYPLIGVPAYHQPREVDVTV